MKTLKIFFGQKEIQPEPETWVGTSAMVKVEEPPRRSDREIIEEIHETFFTEVDRLLTEAKITNSLETTLAAEIEKHDRLVALGFTNTAEVTEAEKEIKRLDALKRENQVKDDLANAINYFSQKYPTYKFITEDSVKKICRKYGLIYGEVQKYSGTVPDKNLQQMEDFKVDGADECYANEVWFNTTVYNMDDAFISTSRQWKLNEREMLSETEFNMENSLLGWSLLGGGNIKYTLRKLPLEIAAPPKDFNLDSTELKDYRLEDMPPAPDDDPIVLKPVWFAGRKHYLIVTAWGLESSDDLVVNERNN